MNPYVTGQTIQMLREKRGLTQKQLAELLFVSDKTISKWETGNASPGTGQGMALLLLQSARLVPYAPAAISKQQSAVK